jgi:inorganic pyrophosphatase/exopolyphosphatase
VACSVAYAEFLNRNGTPAKAVYYGELDLETKYLIKILGELPLEKEEGGYFENDTFVLVDIADPSAIDPSIRLEKVIEIFDHHHLTFAEKFPNAAFKIEKIGACATLMVEKLIANNFEPSDKVKTLLYGAIVSGTINFKNKVTTDRDVKAAKWLESRIDLPPDFIKKMFGSKSQINPTNIVWFLDQYFGKKEIGGKKVGIAQLEVTDLEKLVSENKNLITDFLKRTKIDGRVDYVLFTGIDLYEGFNILITADPESDALFSKALGIERIDGQYKTKEIIMRKEIWPKIGES